MFQSFTTSANRDAGPKRLEALRERMKTVGATMFLVPHADEHQNEYPPERAERLAWLSGFTGSAGFAIATLEKAVVFVDGRYTIQVRDQIDTTVFTSESLTENPPSKWLETNTSEDDIVAYDPWLITSHQLEAYEKALAKTGAKLIATKNLIDQVWHDQSPPPMGRVFVHPLEFSGKPVEEKLKTVCEAIDEKSCDLTLLTDPASLAWLFNIRGNDVVHNPLTLGFAIIPKSGTPLLFIDDNKLDGDTKAYLQKFATVQPPQSLSDELAKLSAGKSVLCDLDQTPVALAEVIKDADGKLVKGRDPIVLPRAIKNEAELNGARAAHVRDGVAMCKFLCWLDKQAPEKVTEISAAKKLEAFRSENATAMGSKLLEISFDTISGYGPNGAIVHYRVTEETDRTFENDALYLCDSGAQYVDGTTDITRTIVIGAPPSEAVTDFTLVLKGHIAIATARFPVGARGVDIDVLARTALWQHGKDYAHGTGHGVGSYMNVHEGPQSISKRGMEPLVPGMIISNEPGYYVEGEYGIRIENLVIVSEAEMLEGGNIETMGFETITLAPIDQRLIDAEMLNGSERDWLNGYHNQVFEKLSPHLSEDETEWLRNATAPLRID